MPNVFDELRDFVRKTLKSGREGSLVLTKIDEAEMWYDRAVSLGHGVTQGAEPPQVSAE